MEGTRLAGSGPFPPRKPLAGEPSDATLFARSRNHSRHQPNEHHSIGRHTAPRWDACLAVDDALGEEFIDGVRIGAVSPPPSAEMLFARPVRETIRRCDRRS
jgi:hypothetical protein